MPDEKNTDPQNSERLRWQIHDKANQEVTIPMFIAPQSTGGEVGKYDATERTTHNPLIAAMWSFITGVVHVKLQRRARIYKHRGVNQACI